MQDETITIEETEQRNTNSTAASNVVHYYVEVGGDLLAKPSALCDLIESEAGKACLVFCNTPSDADFIEVLLKKRGVRVRKLIGHISQAKLSSSIEQIRNEEIQVLVVTDVAAQGLRLRDFELCIIHATHSDPEIYLERTGQTGDNEGGPAKVVSLVGPLDITHFHYIKKIVQITIEKLDLPDASKLAGARLERIRQDALKRNAMNNEKIASLVPLILEDSNRQEIVAYLLQNTLEVLPALSPAAEAKESFEEGKGNSRYNRNDRGSRGSDRSDRDERNGRGRRGSESRGRSQSRDEEDHDNSYGNYDQQKDDRNFIPPKREIRLYIGHGTASGFGKEKFMEILANNSNTPAEEVKRFSERPHYCFVDLSEEFAQSTIDSLSGISIDGGSPLFIKKAIQIPVPRDDTASRNIVSEDGDLSPMPETVSDATETSEVIDTES